MAQDQNKYAKKYARMLFNSCGPEGAGDVIKNLSVVCRITEESRELKNFFLSPLVSDDERSRGIDALSARLSFKEEVKRFLVFIAQRRAVAALPAVLKNFISIYFDRTRKTKATVVTPFKFNGEYERRLLESLKRLTKREVEIEYVYDPELLGGIVVKIGSTMYDGSIRGQLQRLRNRLAGV